MCSRLCECVGCASNNVRCVQCEQNKGKPSANVFKLCTRTKVMGNVGTYRANEINKSKKIQDQVTKVLRQQVIKVQSLKANTQASKGLLEIEIKRVYVGRNMCLRLSTRSIWSRVKARYLWDFNKK